MTEFQCPECKDTGVYQGLNTVEPCRACGGRSHPDFMRLLTDAVCEQVAIETGGQSTQASAKYWRDADFVHDQMNKAVGRIAPSTFDKLSTVCAYWLNDLNGWEWPKAWGESPEWIKQKFSLSGRARYDHEKDRYAHLTSCLRSFTTHREELRVHNVEIRKAMTEAEFSAWYSNRQNPSGGQSIAHETEERIAEEWPKPFDEIMPAELEGIEEDDRVRVVIECSRIERLFEVCMCSIDRPLFGMPKGTFFFDSIYIPGPESGESITGVLTVGKPPQCYFHMVDGLGWEPVYRTDPCSDMLFIPIVED
jgi:hypothetical protein